MHNSFKQPSRSLITFAALSVLAYGSAIAAEQSASPLVAQDAPNCRTVFVVTEERSVVDCPAGKGFTFCFTRKLVDRGGLLTGEMEYFSVGSRSSADPHDPDVVHLLDTATITTATGTIRTEENALYNKKHFIWSALVSIVSATGDLADFEGQKYTSVGYAKGKGLLTGTLCKE